MGVQNVSKINMDSELWGRLPEPIKALIVSYLTCPQGHLAVKSTHVHQWFEHGWNMGRLIDWRHWDLCDFVPIYYAREYRRLGIKTFGHCHEGALLKKRGTINHWFFFKEAGLYPLCVYRKAWYRFHKNNTHWNTLSIKHHDSW